MTGRSILLVDDDRDATEIMRLLLAKAGFKGAMKSIHDANSATQYVDDAVGQSNVPELVIIDLSLREMHGFDLIRHVRKQLPRPMTYIATISASANPDDIAGAFSVGADAYLEKFPTADELRQVYLTLLDHARPPTPICLLRPRNEGTPEPRT